MLQSWMERGQANQARWELQTGAQLYAGPNDMFSTPMDYVFYLSMASNVFSILGLAGVLNQQRELVMAFFTYSTVQMVVVFHYFVDICADVGIRAVGHSEALGSYQQAAAGTVQPCRCSQTRPSLTH
jgi:hypothetical protein